MALEIKAYKEVTAYNAKVMFGMSWRQFFTVAMMVPVLAGAWALFWWLGQDDLGVYVVAVLAVPAAAYGWVRPKGLPFEKYARYVVEHYRTPRVRSYKQVAVWRADRQQGEDTSVHKTTQGARSRRVRARQGAFEATH